MSIDASWLDLKLGLRMLVKHPVLTLIGVLATSFAIGASAAYFEVVNDFIHPTLPLQDGERVVAIQNDDLEAASSERRSLHDFMTWRNELESVEDLGAFTVYSRNLRSKGGSAEPVEVVEISAAAFRVARILPLLGRPLLEADEQNGAPLVVVIGERLWATRFHRDPDIVGRSVTLGASLRTIVGVMPETFALPVNQSLWVPFRLDVLNYARRQGPGIGTIGRLAPGVTLEQAQAELTVIGARRAAQFPGTNARLQPRILPYLKPFTGDGGERAMRLGLNAVFMMLLVIICGNVGTLVFARIATRERELALRTALGASRGRIVMQLFIEALLLTSAGAVIALAALSWGLRRAEAFIWTVEGVVPPFWRNDDLNVTTFLYVGVLTVLGSVVTGALPALRFTKGGIGGRLRTGAVGGAGMRSRRMSTVVIVVQVAISGALLPVSVGTFQLNWSDPAIPGVRAEEYLTIRYSTEEPAGVPARESQARMSAQFAATYPKLKERLLMDGGLVSVTFADQLPGTSNPGRLIQVENEKGGSSSDIQRVRAATVDVNFFDALSAPILQGRGFNSGDLVSGRDAVIVNQPFVQSVLGGRNPIGRRVRYTGSERHEAPSRWYEIVGVVPDLGMSPIEPEEAKGLYHPAAPGEMPSGFMAMRVGRNPDASAEKLRSIAAAVDPTLLVYDMRRLDEISKAEHMLNRAFYLVTASGIYFIVFLSAAVTFALLSFTVSQRTREIGIRKALGAGRRAVVASVFSRAFVQLGLGAGLGALASFLVFSRIPDNYVVKPGVILAMTAFMLLVGFLSCVAPVVRVLRIEPTEAMREEL
jgi:predicted permease